MRDDLDRDELLTDVLEEVAPPAFRAQVCQKALGEVRFRRRVRQLRRGVLSLACIAIVVVLAVRFVAFQDALKSGKANPLLVHSKPLSAGMLVRTRAETVDVVNRANSSVTLVRSAAETCEILGDEELLKLLAGRPVVLVRHGPFESELVFSNPADRDGFPVQ